MHWPSFLIGVAATLLIGVVVYYLWAYLLINSIHF
jgi:hypothetical protein